VRRTHRLRRRHIHLTRAGLEGTPQTEDTLTVPAHTRDLILATVALEVLAVARADHLAATTVVSVAHKGWIAEAVTAGLASFAVGLQEETTAVHEAVATAVQAEAETTVALLAVDTAVQEETTVALQAVATAVQVETTVALQEAATEDLQMITVEVQVTTAARQAAATVTATLPEIMELQVLQVEVVTGVRNLATSEGVVAAAIIVAHKAPMVRRRVPRAASQHGEEVSATSQTSIAVLQEVLVDSQMERGMAQAAMPIADLLPIPPNTPRRSMRRWRPGPCAKPPDDELWSRTYSRGALTKHCAVTGAPLSKSGLCRICKDSRVTLSMVDDQDAKSSFCSRVRLACQIVSAPAVQDGCCEHTSE